MSNHRHLYCVSGVSGLINFPVKVIGASRTAGPSELSWTLSSAYRRVGRRRSKRRGRWKGEGRGRLAILHLTMVRGGASHHIGWESGRIISWFFLCNCLRDTRLDREWCSSRLGIEGIRYTNHTIARHCIAAKLSQSWALPNEQSSVSIDFEKGVTARSLEVTFYWTIHRVVNDQNQREKLSKKPSVSRLKKKASH